MAAAKIKEILALVNIAGVGQCLLDAPLTGARMRPLPNRYKKSREGLKSRTVSTRGPAKLGRQEEKKSAAKAAEAACKKGAGGRPGTKPDFPAEKP